MHKDADFGINRHDLLQDVGQFRVPKRHVLGTAVNTGEDLSKRSQRFVDRDRFCQPFGVVCLIPKIYIAENVRHVFAGFR